MIIYGYEILIPYVLLLVLLITGIVLVIKRKKRPDNLGTGIIFIFIAVLGLVFYSLVIPTPAPGGLPSRCNIGPEFNCEEYHITASDGVMKIVFTPNTNERVENFKVIKAYWAMESVNASKCNDLSGTYEPGDEIEIICDFDESLFPPEGAKMKFTTEMNYTEYKFIKHLTAEIYTGLDE